MKKNIKKNPAFLSKTYDIVKDWFSKYHVPLFTLALSAFASFVVVMYSAEGGEKIFPSYRLGVILIMILEFGFVSLRYIAVSIGASRIMMFFIDIFMIFLFLLTIAPAIVGVNQKVAADRQGPGNKPERSNLVSILEKNNNALNDKIIKNTAIMGYTSSSEIFNELQTENKKLLDQVEENKHKIIEKETEYANALKEWDSKKTIAESKDPFVLFMRDFYLRAVIPGVQILNLIMSLLGSRYLRKIKEGEENINVKPGKLSLLSMAIYNKIYSRITGKSIDQDGAIDDSLTKRLKDHEDRMEQIEKYTEKIMTDMEELAGELGIQHEKKSTDDLFGNVILENGPSQKPVFFKTTLEKR